MRYFNKSLSALLVFLSSCVYESYYDMRLEIVNNSNVPIYVSVSDFNLDSVITINYNPVNDLETRTIPPNSKGIPIRPAGRWEDYFREDSILSFYFFDAQLLKTMPWDSVKANYMILKRYDFGLRDLENMSWTITYP